MKRMRGSLVAGFIGAVVAVATPVSWAQSVAAAAVPAPTAGAAAAASGVDTSNPHSLIDTAAKAMLKEIDANRAAYRKDPMLLYAVVDRILLPHFDVDYAARLVLGRHWRNATQDQRKRFIEAFYRSLLTNYSDALVDFTGDRLKVLPVSVPPSAQIATVRSEIKRSNGQKVPVNYSLRKTPQGWKAWDVVIEGISYVKSFREDFGAEIDQKGLDAVINRLASQKGAPARKT